VSADSADRSPSADLTASVAARVQSVLHVAEREASDLRREVEASAERQAAEILVEADRQAERLLQQAADACESYLQDSRARIDAYVAERVQRVHEATERLLAAAESIALRLDQAGEVRRGLTELIESLGAAAVEAAREGAAPAPLLPDPPDAPRPAEPAQ
jgi:cell division septum initiation protein DivIVA